MKKALIFWFTGLSGAGKTTIATRAKSLLEAKGFSVLIIDGDDVRTQLHKHLGFTEGDIKENNALISQLCQKYRNDYDFIMVPIISPFRGSREKARELLQDGFYEIYLSIEMEKLIKRDVKGLYAKAKNNEIPNLIGFSGGVVYEPPKNPDLIICSGDESVESSVNSLFSFIVNKMENGKQ